MLASSQQQSRYNWFKIVSTAMLLVPITFFSWNVRGGDQGPDIEDYATIEAMINGEPVYSFSNLCYIYGVSPDILPDAVFQEGNYLPKQKIKPKKSWEIKHNLSGCTHEMTVRSPWTDSQPFLPIHLIDGDPNTIWCSWGGPMGMDAPDTRPEWIRIDLPMETTVSAVALVLSNDFPATRYNTSSNKNFGRSLPKELEVRLSKDAWHWDTVYQTEDFVGDPSGTTVIRFDSQPAKQIWIVANNFPHMVSFSGNIFSIGELEVRAPEGNNLALVSRGAGVTVSSVSYGVLNDWFTQKALWGPLQYDLGNKWVRVGAHNGSFTWNYVELEKGKLQVDPWADESITECARNEVNVIMNFDLTMGNHRYMIPPRKLDWRSTRIYDINNNYEDSPPRAFDNPESWSGFLRYVDYMGRHFKGRVKYYELGNEWNVCFPPEQYMEYFEDMYETLKKADPDAKVMIGQLAGGTMFEDLLTCLGQPWETRVHNGRLPVKHGTILMAENSKVGDAKISLDAKVLGVPNEGQFGFVLRYKNEDDYLAAVYKLNTKEILFADPRADKLGNMFINAIAPKVTDLGPEVHLEAVIEGKKVTFTASDEKQSFTTEHTFEGEDFSGPYGMFFFRTRPNQNGSEESFDNLEILDAQGQIVVQETFDGQNGDAPKGLSYIIGGENPVKPGWGTKIDAVGWHSEGIDSKYISEIKELKKKCELLGFRGFYSCGEVGPSGGWLYPPGPPRSRQSEMTYAKVQLRKLFCNASLGIEAGACHPHFTGLHHDQPYTRLTWPSQTYMTLHGAASYYAWRTVATVTDDFYPGDFSVSFTQPEKLMSLTFQSGDKKQLLICAWYLEKMVDGVAEIKTDLTIPGVTAKKVSGIDVFNGTEQELDLTNSGSETLIKGIMVKDYPTLIRVEL